MNHKILEADSEYIKVMGDAQNLEQDHLAFTGIVNNKPISGDLTDQINTYMREYFNENL
jgi:hypothetical protein